MNEEPASAMNTGTPASSTARNRNAMTIIGLLCSSVGCDLMRHVVRPAPTHPSVAPDILNLTDQHQETPECNAAIDIAHRQIEHCHALLMHLFGDCQRDEGEQADKAEFDEIDESQQHRAQPSGLHHV